jgi:hypothetical protein
MSDLHSIDRPQQQRRVSLSGPATTLAVLGLASGLALAGRGEPDRVRAVAFALGVCLAGAMGSWLVSLWPAVTPSARVTAALGTVALRILPALMGLGWLQTGGSELRAAGAGGMLVAFYLVTLAADVVRTIMRSRGAA